MPKALLLLFAVTLSAWAYAKDEAITIESTITGNVEHPKITVLVPWKQIEEADSIESTDNPEANNVFLQPIERKPFLKKTHLLKTVLDNEATLTD